MTVPYSAGMGGAGAARVRPPVRRPGLNVGGALKTTGAALRAIQRPKNVGGIQGFLRSKGYNISVDGQYGPQTAAALVDWRSGVNNRNPSRWNAKFIKLEDPNRTNSPRNSSNHPVVNRNGKTQKPDKSNSNQGNRNVPAVISDKWGKVVMPPGPVQNSPMQEALDLDPASYVDALMQAKYGPVLSELDRRRQQIESSGKNRVDEIRDMYGSYVSGMQERGGAANAEREAMVKATGGLAGAIAGAVPIGEAAASELDTRGDIETDYARLIANSGSDFDRRMADAGQAGGIFAQGQARQETDANLDEVNAQRLDVMNQRGGDVTSARNDLMRWQYEMGQKERELGAGIQSDQIKNKLALLELQAAMRMAPMESQRAQMEINRIMAQIDYTKAQTERAQRPDRPAAGEDKFPSTFAGLTPVDRDNLAATIAKRIPQGAKAAQVTRIVKSALRAIGYDPDRPQVANFGYNLARSFHPKDTSRKWWGLP